MKLTDISIGLVDECRQLLSVGHENVCTMSRSPFTKCALSMPELWVAGFDADELFRSGRLAWRAVESVTPYEYELVMGATTLWVSRDLLQLSAKAGQWLRFEKRTECVFISVDLRTTSRAESRLTNLLGLLMAQPGSALT